MVMFWSLPLGKARLDRPKTPFRYTFEHFLDRAFLVRPKSPVIPIEAVAAGDVQVLAACEQGKAGTLVIDLDLLADFPTVESVVVSTRIRASREIPNIRELLFCSGASFPDATTLRHLTGLETLYSTFGSDVRLDLDAIPAGQMRKLAINRWLTKSLAPLERMTKLEQLKAELFRDLLDPVAEMKDLKYLSIKGPAKGWAKLRECTLLEEAHFIDVQIANLRRWNTWKRLRSFTLSGRGVKSLSGLENLESLEALTLLNTRTNELKPLRELGQLTSLTLRMPAAGLDLESIAQVPMLRSVEIDDSSNTDADIFRIPTLKPIEKAAALREVVLRCTVEDGNLTPLAKLPQLRKVKLASYIGADVEALRAARPDVEIDYTPPDPKWAKLKERVGRITIQRPGEGIKVWSIFESLAELVNVSTNYAAESLIKRDVKKRNPDLAKRLHWDTEGGAVGISADTEADIRSVAETINHIIASLPKL
jgi:hypothetical protein